MNGNPRRGVVLLLGTLVGATGVALVVIAVSLGVEGRAMARAPESPGTSALWNVVIEEGVVPLLHDTGPGSVIRPAEIARTVSRTLLVLGAIGVALVLGAALTIARSTRTDPPDATP